MRPAAVILVASAIVNVALIAAVAFRPSVTERTAEAAASVTRDAGRETASEVPEGNPGNGGGAKPPPEADMWSALSAGEPKELIARLRAAGFPPHVLRTVAQQLVREQQAGRQRELLARFTHDRYWQTSFNRGPRADPAYRAAQRDLAEESRVRLKEMLGADYEQTDVPQEYLATLGRRYGPLDPARSEQLSVLERDYSDLWSQLLMGDGTGIRLPEDNEALRSLHAEMRKDLAALLNPAELEEYDRRNSPTAANGRRRLADLVLSEEEYRSLYELQRGFDERYSANFLSGTVLPDTPEFAQQRGAAQQELTAAVASLLGAERAAEYERAGDFNYQRLKRITQHLGLQREAAVAAFELQREAERRAATIRGDRPLSAEQRATQLLALQSDISSGEPQMDTNEHTLGRRGETQHRRMISRSAFPNRLFICDYLC